MVNAIYIARVTMENELAFLGHHIGTMTHATKKQILQKATILN